VCVCVWIRSIVYYTFVKYNMNILLRLPVYNTNANARCNVYRERRILVQPTCTVAVIRLYIFFSHNFETRRAPTTRTRNMCSIHGLRMRNRLAHARRFGGRWLLFRFITISFLGPWNYISISDREETSYYILLASRNIKNTPWASFFPVYNVIRLRDPLYDFFSLSALVLCTS